MRMYSLAHYTLFDCKANSLQIVTFQPAKVLEGDPDPKIQHTHSEIEIISL